MTIRFCDLDDVELIADIEQVFAIKLTDAETTSCRTFGNLFDCVASRVNHSKDGVCLSALAFRRIRASLAATVPSGARLRPSTRIAKLTSGLSWRRWRRMLQRESSLEVLHMPTVAFLPTGYVWRLAVLTGAAVGPVARAFGVDPKSDLLSLLVVASFAAALAVPVILMVLVRRPHPDLTVADLVRAIAPQNVARLTKPRSIRTADLWVSLEALTRLHGECSETIDRRTRFEHI